VAAVTDPSSTVGRVLVALMLLTSLTLLVRWWLQNRRR
jgi:hypothetical protein